MAHSTAFAAFTSFTPFALFARVTSCIPLCIPLIRSLPCYHMGPLQCVTVLVVFSLLISSAVVANDLPDTILKVKQSIVAIGTIQKTRRPPSKFMGTGFVVQNGNQVVTNFHVLPKQMDKENKEQLVVFVDKTDWASARTAEIIAEDRRHDLVLLKISGHPLPSMTIGNSDKVREGELYAFTGFPIGAVLGHFPVTHQGIVSSITPIAVPVPGSDQLSVEMIRRLNSPFRVFQLDAVAYPGNSGSPLYRRDTGAVIGVVNSGYVKESKETILENPSGITYAIPAKHVNALLEKAQK